MGETERLHALSEVERIEKQLAALHLDSTTLPLHKQLLKNRDHWLAVAIQEGLSADVQEEDKK